jgi:hypothetical protein
MTRALIALLMVLAVGGCLPDEAPMAVSVNRNPIAYTPPHQAPPPVMVPPAPPVPAEGEATPPLIVPAYTLPVYGAAGPAARH